MSYKPSDTLNIIFEAIEKFLGMKMGSTIRELVSKSMKLSSRNFCDWVQLIGDLRDKRLAEQCFLAQFLNSSCCSHVDFFLNVVCQKLNCTEWIG